MTVNLPFRYLLWGLFAVLLGISPVFGDELKKPDASTVVTRSYDLRDLITRSFISTLPAPALGRPYDTPPEMDGPLADPQAIEQDLISRIQNTIELNTWASVPPMKFQDGVLVVRQTPDVQEKVATLIDQLRHVPRPQILVAAEFFQIKKTEPNNVLSVAAERNTILDTVSAQKLRKVAERDPAIEASQAQLEIVNGTRAYSLAGGTFRYVADYTAVGAGPNVKYEPKYAYQIVGRLFEIERALVSADRKYVTLDIRTATSKLEWMKTSLAKESVGLSVQYPMTSTTEIRTRITLPNDGGAIVLAGSDKSFYVIVQAKIAPNPEVANAN